MPYSPTLSDSSDVAGQVRGLAHDLTANFMVLEASVRLLKRMFRDDPGEDTADALAQVEACLRESKRYLDDLQQVSRSGHVDFEPRRLDLARLIRDVLEEQAPLVAARKIAVEVAASLPAIWCNETRAKQVLTNLIRNAALHGCHPRRPRIRITAAMRPSPVSENRRASTQASDWVWVRIHDNGPGIPAEHRESVFLPGARLATAKAAGTGTGLATVAEVVAHYGGAVWIDGRGRGTAFVFSLPHAPVVGADPGTTSPPVPHLFRTVAKRRNTRTASRSRAAR